jgi:putative tryptophan/tyrosine transport system substrate-binding protein
MVPNAAVIGVLINPRNPNAASQVKDAQQAARALGLALHIVSASSERDFDAAFASLVQQGANALVVASDPFLFDRRDQLVALAALYAVPAVYDLREYATAGGLIVTATASPMPTVRLAFTPVGFSRAPSPRIFQSCSRPGSI